MTDWAAFCSSIRDRITYARRLGEGFDGREQTWRTFDPPLSARPAAPRRPILLRLAPISTLERDDRGRFLPRRKTA